MASTVKSTVLWNVTPCSLVHIVTTIRCNLLPPSTGWRYAKQGMRKKQAASLHSKSSTLKMEAVYSSETLTNFYRSTRRHTQEGSIVNLSLACCELSVYNMMSWSRLMRGVMNTKRVTTLQLPRVEPRTPVSDLPCNCTWQSSERA
jgi:hypothetical protein